MKSFKFHNAKITMERKGYGQYTITGMGRSIHSTSSLTWDWCNDESDKTKNREAKKYAYQLLKKCINL